MDIKVNKTAEGTLEYPLHRHKRYEIMHYVSGQGVMKTEYGDIAFDEGTVVVIPPNTLHGSSAGAEFTNISVEADFDGLLIFDRPVALCDLENGEGRQLAELMYRNRYGNEGYLHALCTAYARYLLQRARGEDDMTACVREIVRRISDGALDPQLNVTEILRQCGFAEDYVRACFKQKTGKTPIGFLAELRVRHACYLIDVYGDSLPFGAIAERCGFLDYVYFSKKFKSIMGVSPREYKKA